MSKPERDRTRKRSNEHSAHRFLDERRDQRRKLSVDSFRLQVVRNDDVEDLKGGEQCCHRDN